MSGFTSGLLDIYGPSLSAVLAVAQLDEADRERGTALRCWCGALGFEHRFLPDLSPLALGGSAARDHAEYGAAETLVGLQGHFGPLPTGFWGGLLRGEEAALNAVENMCGKRYGLVELDHQVRQHVRGQRFEHGDAAIQVRKLFIGHRLISRLVSWWRRLWS